MDNKPTQSRYIFPCLAIMLNYCLSQLLSVGKGGECKGAEGVGHLHAGRRLRGRQPAIRYPLNVANLRAIPFSSA